jgi:hypothetical protein
LAECGAVVVVFAVEPDLFEVFPGVFVEFGAFSVDGFVVDFELVVLDFDDPVSTIFGLV